MAEFDWGATHTLVEVANRTNNKQLLDLVRSAEPFDNFMETSMWRLANRLDSERVVRQSGLPTVGMGGINKSVVASVDHTEPDSEPIGIVEDRNELPRHLVEMQQNPAMYRMQSDMSHFAAVNKKLLQQVLYGDRVVDPDQLPGIINRAEYDALADTYVTGAGDSSAGAVTSAFLIQWGYDQVYMVYPENSSNIVKMENKGLQLITTNTTTGARKWMYVTNFTMKAGLVVADPRCIHRICNIGTTTANYLPLEKIFYARARMKNGGVGATLYVHPIVKGQIDEQAFTKPNRIHQETNRLGMKVTYIDDIRIATADTISLTETVVT